MASPTALDEKARHALDLIHLSPYRSDMNRRRFLPIRLRVPRAQPRE
jgi:hypothetical protein